MTGVDGPRRSSETTTRAVAVDFILDGNLTLSFPDGHGYGGWRRATGGAASYASAQSEDMSSGSSA